MADQIADHEDGGAHVIFNRAIRCGVGSFEDVKVALDGDDTNPMTWQVTSGPSHRLLTRRVVAGVAALGVVSVIWGVLSLSGFNHMGQLNSGAVATSRSFMEAVGKGSPGVADTLVCPGIPQSSSLQQLLTEDVVSYSAAAGGIIESNPTQDDINYFIVVNGTRSLIALGVQPYGNAGHCIAAVIDNPPYR